LPRGEKLYTITVGGLEKEGKKRKRRVGGGKVKAEGNGHLHGKKGSLLRSTNAFATKRGTGKEKSVSTCTTRRESKKKGREKETKLQISKGKKNPRQADDDWGKKSKI